MKRERYRVVAVREDHLLPDDRRRAPRATCEYSAEFVDPGTGVTVRGTVMDISQVGMRLRTGGHVRIHEKENLRFYVWVNGSLLKLNGSVRRHTHEGHLGIEFHIDGEKLKSRVGQTVSQAAHRNLDFETRKEEFEDLAPRDQGTVRAAAQAYMRGGSTIHDGLAAAKAGHASVGGRWIGRRVASHFSD